jgi:hypothetical protein
LDFKLDGSDLPPTPSGTDRPETGTWKRVYRTDPHPKIGRKLAVLRGRFESDKVEGMLLDVQSFRIELEQLAMAKALDNEKFRRIEIVTREFSRARSDGLLSEAEADAARMGYGTILRDVFTTASLATLKAALLRARDLEAPELKEQIRRLRTEVERLAKAPPHMRKVKEAHQTALELLDRVHRAVRGD